MARINNTVSTRGSVISVQLYFNDAPMVQPGTLVPLYLETGSEYAEYGTLVHYVSERISAETSIATLKSVCSDISQLFEVNRLDVVMHLVDQIVGRNLGIEATAEFDVLQTGHGEPTFASHRLLVKGGE